MEEFKKNFSAGIAQGSILTLLGYPYDTVKTRLQTINSSSKKFGQTFRIYKTEGIRGFYKGVSMPFLNYVSKRPSQYALGEYLKKTTSFNYFIIGGIQGSIGTVIGNPFQVVKIYSQCNKQSPLDNIKTIYNTEGVKGFYKGFKFAWFRDISFGTAFVGSYFNLRDRFGNDTNKQIFFNALGAHLFSWTDRMSVV